MKFLKGFLNVILTIVLIALVFTISLTFILKKVFQEEILIGIGKNAIIEKYIDTDKVDLTDEQKSIIKNILNKKGTKEVLNVIFDNYLAYTVIDDYKLSSKDYNLIIKYINKNIDEISKISSEIDANYIKENLSYDNLNKFATEAFKMIDSEGGMELSNDDVKIINAYAYIVSDTLRGYLLTAIGIVVLLLMLVNWSVTAWLLEAGIAFIVSGSLVSLVYVLIETIKGLALEDSESRQLIQNIDLSYTVMLGVFLTIIGIAAIIIKNKINNNEIKENIA